MFLSGNLNLQGPGFEKKDITFESDVSGEFYLNTRNAAQLAIGDFDIWVQMDKENVIEFNTTVEDHGKEITDSLCLVMGSVDGKNNLTLTISLQQTIVLKQILEHYITACYAIKALSTERTAKRV